MNLRSRASATWSASRAPEAERASPRRGCARCDAKADERFAEQGLSRTRGSRSGATPTWRRSRRSRSSGPARRRERRRRARGRGRRLRRSSPAASSSSWTVASPRSSHLAGRSPARCASRAWPPCASTSPSGSSPTWAAPVDAKRAPVRRAQHRYFLDGRRRPRAERRARSSSPSTCLRRDGRGRPPGCHRRASHRPRRPAAAPVSSRTT